MPWKLVCLALTLLSSLAAGPPIELTPIEQTPYGKAVFRIEGRPGPQQMKDAAQRRALEGALAQAGVDGRWISIVDPTGHAVKLSCEFPPAAARLPLRGETLEVKRVGNRFQIDIPPIGLYQVVELKR